MTGVPTHGFPVGVPGYQSLGLLGQGASGQVFKARQRSTGQFVAIKIPSTPSTHDPAARRRVHQRLHQETRVLAMLQHANVVRLIDKGMANGGLLFAVLEFIPGETLRDYLQRNGRLGLPDTIALMAQVLDVLAFLHARHIVHRDLKPENIMVVPTAGALHAKVLDFGLASYHGEPLFVGGVDGTPAYCAPEQLRGELCLPATDIYAWALIFVECVNARPGVSGAGIAEVLEHQLSTTAIALPEELLGPPLTALLRRTLHKDARQRADDATHLHGELTQCLRQLRGEQPVPDAPLLALARKTPDSTAQQMTLDAVQPTVAPHAGPLHQIIVCLTVRVYPRPSASVTLSDLQQMREDQMQWCANAVQTEHGHIAGTLGDCMVFYFEPNFDSARSLHLAANLAIQLCARVQRKSRMLDVQHGVRLEISGALHTASLHSHRDTSGYNQAANMALHLNSLAEPGAIIVSPCAHGELDGSVAMEIYTSTRTIRARESRTLHRLVTAPGG